MHMTSMFKGLRMLVWRNVENFDILGSLFIYIEGSFVYYIPVKYRLST